MILKGLYLVAMSLVLSQTSLAQTTEEKPNAAVQFLTGLRDSLGKAKDGLQKAAEGTPSSFKGILAGEPRASWPRVALTIHKLPRNAYESSLEWKYLPANYCMRVSAKVWADAKSPRDIPEEEFCARQAPNFEENFGHGDFLMWSMEPSNTPHTGPHRTNGPTPPSLLFPEGNKYTRFGKSKGGNLFGALLVTMGFDMSVGPGQDRRLWVVSLPSENELR